MFPVTIPLLLLLFLPQGAPNPAQEATVPEPPPAYDEGPLEIELVAMREVRMRMVSDEERQGFESDLRMQFRVKGEKLKSMSRFGNIILTELIDSNGEALVDEETYTNAELEATRPNNLGDDRLKANGLLLISKSKESSRGATHLKSLKGYVRVILAEGTETITIDNPLQYYGGMIKDDRLDAIGMQIRVVPFDEFEQNVRPDRMVIVEYVTMPDNVREVNFYDGWMKQIQSRAAPMTSEDGKECQAFYMDPAAMTDHLQMVLEVHPKVEEVRVEYEATDVELP
jgi:hypothetical protein